MHKPHFVSRPAHVPVDGDLTLAHMLRDTGGNTGNLLFISSLRRVLGDERSTSGVAFEPTHLRECDGLIVPAANWLKASSDFGNLAARIEATTLPCVVVGLGAQAPKEGQIPKLQPGTLRFLSVVAERSKSIAVRGEFSAQVLEAYGFKEVVVTGCPSLLWHVDRGANVAKQSKRIAKISINGTRGEFDEVAFKPVYEPGLQLARMAMRLSADYVAQTELPDMYFGMERFAEEDGVYERALAFVKRIYGVEDEMALRGYLTAHVKTFFNVETWIDYLRKRDFAIGTRLHGIIAALLAGTPGLLLTHDSRTTEAARALSIPSIDARSFDYKSSLQELYDAVSFDEFNDAQDAYIERFRQFFKDNGVSHRLPEKRSAVSVFA
nr:polysaccharide pyruvyl transferase family protein [Nitrosomonas nitrosa]